MSLIGIIQKRGSLLRYVLVGVVAAAIHYGVYIIVQQWLAVNIAYTIGYVISFVINFYLTSYFTFHAKPSWRKLVGFGCSHFINYILHMVLLNMFLILGVSKLIAPLLVLCFVVPLNYVLLRFVFVGRKRSCKKGQV